MKKIQSLQYSTIFLVMLFIVSSPSFANWHEVKCPDENDYNTIVHFWDSVNVLFVQGDGDAAFSTDGGNVWDNPYYPDNSPHLNGYIDFHKDFGYSTAGNFGEPGDFIYKFTKPGEDFELIGTVKHEVTFGYHEEIYFYNDDVAVYRTPYNNSEQDRGWRLYKTNNGGDKWERRRSFPLTNLEQVYIVSDNDYYSYLDNKSMQKSDSNIVSWVSSGFKPNNRYCFQMPDENTGYYADGKVLYKTIDEWAMKTEALVAEQNEAEISCLNFIDIDTGWLGLSNGKLYKTNNGGLSWVEDTLNNVPFQYELVGIQTISFGKAVCKIRNKENDLKAHYFKNFGDATHKRDEIPSKEATLTPNPANSFIELSSVYTISEISLYNSIGGLIKHLEGNMDTGTLHIDVTQLPTGAYFLKYKVDKEIRKINFIINR